MMMGGAWITETIKGEEVALPPACKRVKMTLEATGCL